MQLRIFAAASPDMSKLALLRPVARLAIIAIAFFAQPCHAAGIALIKSYDFEPYDIAIAGFIGSCGNGIIEYKLHDESGVQSDLTQTIRNSKPDVVFAIGVLAAEFAQQEFGDLPILFAMVPRLRADELSGTNIAGITLDIPVDQQLRVYASMVSGLTSLGVIYDPEKSGNTVIEARAAAAEMGMTLHTREVRSRKEVPSAMRALLKEEKIEVLWMIPDETVVTPDSFKFLLIQSFEHNLPFLAASDIFVKVGALASITPDYTDIGRQSCELANAMNSGNLNLAIVNVVEPAKFNLSINLKTARKIGLSIPNDILKSADVVYR